MQGEAPRRGWREAAAVYADRRMLVILAMGFSSGLPLLLTLGTLDYWMREVGVDLQTIGLFALVGLPYSFKFLWAPVLDHAPLPPLTRLLGRRRGWALATQLGLAAAIVALGASDPAHAPLATAAAALAVAFFSASQDVVVDAYRIEILGADEQGAGAAATQLGYRIGMLASGAGALALAAALPWSGVYAVMAALVGVGVVAALAAPEPARGDAHAAVPAAVARGAAAAPAASGLARIAAALRVSVVEPLADFVGRRGWVAILLLALLYKFGDAVSGKMANPFYVDMAFTKLEVASVTKVWSIVATMAGVAVGGALVAGLGTFRALLVGGVLQAATNLLYSLLAVTGHSVPMLAVAVGADSFTGGLASAAFVAYLSGLCNARFTATQYALLTSLMAAGRTALSSGSGWLAAALGWAPFFALTAALAIPGLLLLVWLMRLEGGDDASAAASRAPAVS
ncbi:MAG TPA: MFS transporter [Myxococcota bacterium]|nr:MFS transporter [Myxococcota bacterium]